MSSSDEEVSLKRPGSTIPLADGSMPGTPAASDSDAETSSADEGEVEAMLAELRQAAEAQVPARPTPAQQAGEVAREIARTKAREAIDQAEVTTREKLKYHKEMEKSGAELLDEQHAENVRVMNGYRNEYRGKINFRFRNGYTVEMKPSMVKAERSEVETILATQDLPTILKGALLNGAKFLESISLLFGLQDFNLSMLAEKTKINADSGYFDAELKELSIQWAGWLNLSPEKRLGAKCFWLVAQTAMDNNPRLKAARGAQINVLSKDYLDRNNDL